MPGSLSKELGVIVDSVTEVLMFKDEDILAPGNEQLVVEKFIYGIGMLADRLLILLKPEEILGGDEFQKGEI